MILDPTSSYYLTAYLAFSLLFGLFLGRALAAGGAGRDDDIDDAGESACGPIRLYRDREGVICELLISTPEDFHDARH